MFSQSPIEKKEDPLIKAATWGTLDMVSDLLKKKAAVDSQDENGITALIAAAARGHQEIVSTLLTNKATIDQQDKYGKSALIWAALSGQSEIISTLLANKATIDFKDKEGRTALIWAADYGNSKTLRMLLEKKAAINHQANDGQTALINAVYHDRWKNVQELLKHGANCELQDDDGNTALSVAKMYQYEHLVTMIENPQQFHKSQVNISEQPATLTEEKTQIKRIKVVSLDFDGCIFHREYISEYMKLRATPDEKITEDPLFYTNKAIFAKIKSDFSENRFDDMILMDGSNRQSKRIDEMHSSINETESCFTALMKLETYLQKEITKNCHVDKFLTSDLCENKLSGENFENRIKNNIGYEFSSYFFDYSKLIILYAQMHKVASENPNVRIDFDFYDDTTTILSDLKKFFNLNPDLIPHNLQLNLHKYAGRKVESIATIKGTGEIDNNYRDNIKKMLWCANQNKDVGDVLKYLLDRSYMTHGEFNKAGKWLGEENIQKIKALLIGQIEDDFFLTNTTTGISIFKQIRNVEKPVKQIVNDTPIEPVKTDTIASSKEFLLFKPEKTSTDSQKIESQQPHEQITSKMEM